jgi:predicted dehydrogenase
MKALFIGLGGVGQRHLRNLKALRPDAEVCAVRHGGRTFEIGDDLKADFNTDIVAKYGITELRSMDEAIAFKPDVAFVANPSSEHVNTCLRLIEAGIPTFVEKPAAIDRDGLAALLDSTAKHHSLLMVGYQLRFHPCVKHLKIALDQQRVGAIQSVEVAVHSHMPSWHSYETPDAFYAGVKILGGGVVLTEIHEIDLLCWLFGPAASVMAFQGAPSDLALDVEETVGAIMTHGRDGRTFPTTLMMSFMQRPPARRFAVNGEAGRIVMEIPRLRVTIESTDGHTDDLFNDPEFDRASIFLEELAHFLDCAETRTEPLTSLARIADGQRTALAILESLGSANLAQP